LHVPSTQAGPTLESSLERMLSSLCLRVLHLLYSLAVYATIIWNHFNRTKPQPLSAKRTKSPSHLALLLVHSDELGIDATEKCFVECVVRAVTWCRTVGIEKLTVYDSQGITLNCSQDIQERLLADQPISDDDSDSEVEYPLTPPLSDSSESRSISPEYGYHLGVVTIQVSKLQARKSSRPYRRRNVLKRRRTKDTSTPVIPPLTLNLVSRESSKPGIASVARSYIRNLNRTMGMGSSPFELSMDELNSALEGPHGLQSPDFMIVHHISPSYGYRIPLELYGFPPWQMRLSEIFHNRYPESLFGWLHPSPSSSRLLGEEEFRMALDEFAGAEMRQGK